MPRLPARAEGFRLAACSIEASAPVPRPVCICDGEVEIGIAGCWAELGVLEVAMKGARLAARRVGSVVLKAGSRLVVSTADRRARATALCMGRAEQVTCKHRT
jgi:hypothetical protein